MSSWAGNTETPEKSDGTPGMPVLLGIDTGGTFTDLVFADSRGDIRRWKVLSTPDDPARAIVRGIGELLGDFSPKDLEIVHGTTVGTNAFLERKGARTCLITTKGFEDVIFIGRQNRPALYDLMVEKPPPVLESKNIFGLSERTKFEGQVLKAPSQEELAGAAAFCRKAGAESIAVCLLHSYANPENERITGAFLERKGLSVFLSSDILPEFREFERTSTTVINAYLGPVVGRYVQRLEKALAGSKIFIQQSSGGCRPSAGIGKFAVTTLLSGPAGGVAASLKLGRSLGFQDIITFDMGGTSTDVSLCAGDFTYTREYRIEGFPISLPMIDIHTVGAGGGSIAWIDRGGLMKVGPESAGADPGPVCYGRGERLTVTDANLFLGRLRAQDFLGGRMRLDEKGVRSRMEKFSKRLNLTPEKAALGIIRIVNINMIQAIRTVSLERGFDPRQFVLVSFGGAAGLHCLELARELGITKVLIPAMAGVFSAKGMAAADLVFEGSASVFFTASRDMRSDLADAFRKLDSRLEASASGAAHGGSSVKTERFLDVRYKGQSFEITIPFSADWKKKFHTRHQRLYGYHVPGGALEITAIRCRLTMARKQKAKIFPIPKTKCGTGYSGLLKDCPKTQILFEDGLRELPVIYRDKLSEGCKAQGPLLIIDDFTTVLIPEGWETADYCGHLLAQKR